MLNAIAKKYGGEFSTSCAVFNVGAGSKVGLYFDIPSKWVAYPIRIYGYSTEDGVKVNLYKKVGEFYHQKDQWGEFPDVFFEYYPQIIDYRVTIAFGIENSSANTATLLIGVDAILIPETNSKGFEDDLLAISELPNMRWLSAGGKGG